MASPAVAFAPVPDLSRSEIDRAGSALRDYLAAPFDGSVPPDVVQALITMIEFREAFQTPLSKTVNGLRSMVLSEWPDLKAEGARIPVVQRLKRQEQMMFKLRRFPSSKLSNMGDIGGCRAVLDHREQVDGVVKRIRKNWHVHGKIRDTRDQAALSGYRAVHVIVVRDGRRIEIQLRTPREHEWAVAVERTGARLGIHLKEGEGPEELKKYFRLASHGIYLDSVGEEPSADFLAEFGVMQEQVRPYFTR